MRSLLGCFCPPIVVVVDDDVSFMQSVAFSLKQGKFTLKTFSKPELALEFINDSKSYSLSISDFMYDDFGDSSENPFNVNCICTELENKNRFNRVAAVISDYSMPNLTGVDLCSRVNDPNIQKILLTSERDRDFVIEAFNNKYIDAFISKTDTDLTDKLVTTTNTAIKRYYSVFTNDLEKFSPRHQDCCLKDPVFLNFFSEVCSNKVKYSEYYMLDWFGSFVFLTENGDVSWLSVLSAAELEKLIQIGSDFEETDTDVLAALKSGNYILTYHDLQGTLPPITQWGEYLKPAQRLKGYQDYYYYLGTDKKGLNLDLSTVTTYREFYDNMVGSAA